MLDEKQKKWIIDKCNVLLVMSKNIYDMEQTDWEMMLEAMNKYTRQTKGNAEVKAALLETEAYIEHMYKILKG